MNIKTGGTKKMASKKQGTKKEEGKSLKSKNTVKTIDQMTVARQIAEKFGFKLSDILAVNLILCYLLYFRVPYL